MKAIIKTGGKQYQVKEGDILHVELLGDQQEGSVQFSEVLMLTDGKNSVIGEPTIPGCVVEADILGIAKGPKVTSIKFKRRCNQRRRIGHRQKMHQVKIQAIKKG